MKGIIIAYIAIAVIGFGGWVANIVKLVNSGFEVAQWGGMEVARVIGIFFAPLGAVLGFC